MKVMILAGGYGSRLGEETTLVPKPMVEIGGRPILWHIMKTYSQFGHNEFVLLLGYKGHVIKDYFANYFLYNCDCTIDLTNNEQHFHNNGSESWKVTLVDTGLQSMTGARIRKARQYVGDQPFMLTYGDGVADIDIDQLIRYHQAHKRALTMTSVRPEGRFGAIEIGENNRVESFVEKPKNGSGWVNGGFFVCEPKVFDYIPKDESCVFEHQPLERMAEDGELFTYRHQGFWKCMDTMRDKNQLNELWNNGEAKWKVWAK